MIASDALSNGLSPRLYVGFRLIDGTERDPVDDAYLLIHGSTIAAVGQATDLRPSDRQGVKETDLSGRTVIPGLIDCHTHLHYGALRSQAALDTCPVEVAAINAALHASKVLRAGFTTIRDVGTISNVAAHVRDAVSAGRLLGPRIIASGRVIAPTTGPVSGHGVNSDLTDSFGMLADGPTEFRKAVRREARDGVDNIKFMASGVEIHPRLSTKITVTAAEELHAGIDEAHRLGLTVAVHCQSIESAKMAAQSGADTIEHATRLDEETIDSCLSNGVSLVPTLSTPISVIRMGEGLGLPLKQRQEAAENLPIWLDSLKHAKDAGVPIAAGGDIGNRYEHGMNARELSHLCDAGLTPMEAIRSATSVAAKALAREDRIGSLAAGKAADFLVLWENPIDNIQVLERPEAIENVFLRGAAVPRFESDRDVAEGSRQAAQPERHVS